LVTDSEQKGNQKEREKSREIGVDQRAEKPGPKRYVRVASQVQGPAGKREKGGKKVIL